MSFVKRYSDKEEQVLCADERIFPFRTLQVDWHSETGFGKQEHRRPKGLWKQ
jgi:hypothetical protein